MNLKSSCEKEKKSPISLSLAQKARFGALLLALFFLVLDYFNVAGGVAGALLCTAYWLALMLAFSGKQVSGALLVLSLCPWVFSARWLDSLWPGSDILYRLEDLSFLCRLASLNKESWLSPALYADSPFHLVAYAGSSAGTTAGALVALSLLLWIFDNKKS